MASQGLLAAAPGIASPTSPGMGFGRVTVKRKQSNPQSPGEIRDTIGRALAEDSDAELALDEDAADLGVGGATLGARSSATVRSLLTRLQALGNWLKQPPTPVEASAASAASAKISTGVSTRAAFSFCSLLGLLDASTSGSGSMLDPALAHFYNAAATPIALEAIKGSIRLPVWQAQNG